MSIQKMRLQRGWSQQQLADVSGLSARTIQRIEAGHPGSVESMKSIAAVFEVDFSTLKNEANTMNKVEMSEENRERIAFQKVRRMRGWYLHVTMYFVVILASAAIDLFTTPGIIWFIGLALFWGIGLLFHAMTVFFFDKYFGGAWELKQVEKLLGRPL